MVRAILKGEKTQTRRIATNLPPPPENAIHPNHERLHPAPYLDAYCSEKKTPQNPRGMSTMWCWWTPDNRMGREFRCCYGQPGDLLWVRETWGAVWPADEPVPLRHCEIEYRADLPPGCTDRPGEWPADEGNGPEVPKWRPSIHMPRWASRITLRITDIRVERLHDITEDDARAEGCEARPFPGPWWQGYRDFGDGELIHQQAIGETPPEWMIEPKKMPATPWLDRSARDGFRSIWMGLHGPDAWDENPWVWAISFERVKP
jgi:hypothetical protein